MRAWYSMGLSYGPTLQEILQYGEVRGSRAGLTRDLGVTSFATRGPVAWELVPNREGKLQFAYVEQLCYLAGVDPDPLEAVAPHFSRFRETDGSWWGSYGPRLREAMPMVIQELRRHPESRRAVLPLWSWADLSQVSRNGKQNLPCTVELTFWLSSPGHQSLNAHVVMRSCDAWFGLYYDLPAFSMLMEAAAWVLGVKPGNLYLTCTSLHLYEPHWERAKEVRANRHRVPRTDRLQLSWEWEKDPTLARVEPMNRVWTHLTRWALGRLVVP